MLTPFRNLTNSAAGLSANPQDIAVA